MKKCLSCCKESWRNSPILSTIFWIVVCIAVLVFIFWFIIPIPWLHVLLSSHSIGCTINKYDKADALFYYLASVGTIALVIVAYSQTVKIRAENESEFFLHIDEQWKSKEIVKARVILHGMYLKKMGSKLPSNDLTAVQEKIVRMQVGEAIVELSKESSEGSQENFIHLINLLDFMETIGYLHKEKGIRTEKLQELLGDSIQFYYQTFERYIEYRQKNYPNIYSNFGKLHNDLPKNFSA